MKDLCLSWCWKRLFKLICKSFIAFYKFCILKRYFDRGTKLIDVFKFKGLIYFLINLKDWIARPLQFQRSKCWFTLVFSSSLVLCEDLITITWIIHFRRLSSKSQLLMRNLTIGGITRISIKQIMHVRNINHWFFSSTAELPAFYRLKHCCWIVALVERHGRFCARCHRQFFKCHPLVSMPCLYGFTLEESNLLC